MNLRKYTFLFFLFLIVKPGLSQNIVEPGLVKWYSIEEADSLFKKQAKPIFIDVYTEWCGWCKHMMKTTFANPGIASYINSNFYPVRFDAETFDTVTYNNKTYINRGGANKPKHDFAAYILNNRFSFPTIVYIDRQKNIYPIPGYMKIKEIEPLLVYFSEEINLNAKYDDWKNLYYFNYSGNYKEEIVKIDNKLHPDTTGSAKWESFKEATELSEKDGKPIFVYFYSDWCHSCRIMQGTVFRNNVISEIINKKFHPVIFDAASQNTEIFFGKEMEGTGSGKPHKLTYGLLKQNFKFPAFVIIDSNKQKLIELHGFMLPYQLETFLTYFVDDKYKNLSFEEYVKNFSGKLSK